MRATNKHLDGYVCVDFETIEIRPDGSTLGSTEAYRDNFRVDSAAFTWQQPEDGSIQSTFIQGEEAVGEYLRLLGDAPLLAFNVQYEMLVAACRYPHLNLNWAMDAQRLAQLYDNGGPDDAFETVIIEPEDEDEEATIKRYPLSGFSLVKCVKRILGGDDHKAEAYEWLRKNGVKKGEEGANLNRLPPEILEKYNTGDTEQTWHLAAFLLDYFDSISFDWRLDHQLYFNSVRYIAATKRRGVYVDRARLGAYIVEVEAEIFKIAEDFLQRFAEPIKAVERAKLLEEIRGRKTLRGRKKYLKRIRTDSLKWAEDIAFNVGSNKQLEALFVGVLGIEPRFHTAKGSPSFKSSVLSQWGEGGALLEKRRKRLIVLNQAKALYELSEYDSRWHLNLRAVGSANGRYSGGYG